MIRKTCGIVRASLNRSKVGICYLIPKMRILEVSRESKWCLKRKWVMKKNDSVWDKKVNTIRKEEGPKFVLSATILPSPKYLRMLHHTWDMWEPKIGFHPQGPFTSSVKYFLCPKFHTVWCVMGIARKDSRHARKLAEKYQQWEIWEDWRVRRGKK